MGSVDEQNGAVSAVGAPAQEGQRRRPRAARGPETVGNVDQIRDILFGGQMREYERRFARLEERMAKEAGRLRDDLEARVDTLETYVRRELEALATRLQTEEGERVEGQKRGANQVETAAQELTQRIGQVGEESVRSTRELREQMLEQTKSLGEQIKRRHDLLAGELARETEQLRGDKADRAVLSGLLAEVALRLRDEFELPDGT